MTVKKTSDQKVTQAEGKNLNPDQILKQLEEIEERITLLETNMKDIVTFDGLVVRLTDTKSKPRKRTRTTREWTQDEKDAFHKRIVEARQEAIKPEPA